MGNCVNKTLLYILLIEVENYYYRIKCGIFYYIFNEL